MLLEEQVKKLASLNESLQFQLKDANAIIEMRNEEVAFLSTGLAETTALRSKMDGQQDEIENFRYLLYKKDQNTEAAVEREITLQHELTGLARLNNKYNELLKDYTYLNSRFADVQARLTALNERNFELEQVAARIGELQSILENGKIERDGLQNRITKLESQKYLKEPGL